MKTFYQWVNQNLFSETNYKKQTFFSYIHYIQMRSLQFNLKKSFDLHLKNSDYLIKMRLTSWYIRFGLEKYPIILIALGLVLGCSPQITLLQLDWYDVLDLDWKSTWTTLLRLILFYIGLRLIRWINQAEMPFEKYEHFLELSAKQFVIESSPIYLG